MIYLIGRIAQRLERYVHIVEVSRSNRDTPTKNLFIT